MIRVCETRERLTEAAGVMVARIELGGGMDMDQKVSFLVDRFSDHSTFITVALTTKSTKLNQVRVTSPQKKHIKNLGLIPPLGRRRLLRRLPNTTTSTSTPLSLPLPPSFLLVWGVPLVKDLLVNKDESNCVLTNDRGGSRRENPPISCARCTSSGLSHIRLGAGAAGHRRTLCRDHVPGVPDRRHRPVRGVRWLGHCWRGFGHAAV